jgi:two-component system, OmpR family, response regulator
VRVFIVDDDPAMVELLERQLRLSGHEVVGTYTAAIGVTMHVMEHVAVAPLSVLLDVDWPGMPGYGAYATKLLKRVPGVSVYLCSSRSDEELHQLARESGADGWFSKSETASIGDKLTALE